MDLFSALENRRSTRRFRDEGIPRDTLKKIVGFGTLAPNAGNQQTWRFIVVDETGKLLEMKKIVDSVIKKVTGEDIPAGKLTFQNLFAGAPAAIVAIMKPYESGTDRFLKEQYPDRYRIRQEKVNPSLQSISSAITQMLLAAHGMGIGTCWMTGPLTARPELEEFFAISPPEEIAAIIALGYAAKPSRGAPKRKPVDEVLSFLD
jgi:nitroreductase